MLVGGQARHQGGETGAKADMSRQIQLCQHLLFQIIKARHDEFEELREEDDSDGVVAVGGGPVPGARHQHTLSHEHQHVGHEHHLAPRAGEQLGPNLPWATHDCFPFFFSSCCLLITEEMVVTVSHLSQPQNYNGI